MNGEAAPTRSFEDMLAHLEQELENARENPTLTANTLISMGRLQEETLKQPEKALFHYKRALDFLPESWESKSEHAVYFERAIDGIIRILLSQGRYPEVEEELKRAIQAAPERLRRAQLLALLGEILLHQLNKPEDAMRAFEQALDLDPLNRPLYGELNDLYVKQGRWDDVVRNLASWLELTQDRPTAIQIMVQMGEVTLTHKGDVSKALQIFEEVLLLNSDNSTALRGLEKVYRESRRFEELATILERQSGLPEFRSADEQVRIGINLAELYMRHVVDHQQAERYLQKVLTLQPQKTEAREMLASLYEAKANWVEVFQVYQQDLEFVSDPMLRAERLLKMGEIVDTHLGRQSEAISYFERAYEEIKPLSSQFHSKVGEMRDSLARHLLRHWQETEQSEKLREYYLLLSENGKTILEKIYALKNLSLLFEGEAAHSYLKKLVELCKANRGGEDGASKEIRDYHQGGLKELGKVWLKKSKWKDLIENYRELIEVLEDDDEKGLYHFRIGEIQREHLQEIEAAIESYGKALEFHPNLAPAIRAQRELLIKEGEYAEALQLFQMELPLLNHPKVQAGLFFQMGCFREEFLGQNEEAIKDYSDTIRLDPLHVEALTRLAVHYYHNEEWQKAAPLFERLAEKIEKATEMSPLKRAAFWVRRARISEALEDLEGAEEFLKNALKIDAGFLPAIESYAELCRRNHRWHEARHHYLDALKLYAVGDSAEGLDEALESIYYKLGLIAQQMKNVAEAHEYFHKTIDSNPRNMTALEALVNLETLSGNWNSAQQVYDLILRQTDNSNDWITIQFAKADIWEKKLGKPKNAIGCFKEVLKRDPFNTQSLEKLAQLYCETGEIKKGIEIMGRLLDGERSDEQRIQYLHQLGRIYRHALKNLNQAEYYFKQILHLKSEHLPALKELVEIQLEKKSWLDLIETYQRIISYVAKSDRLLTIPFYLKLGQIYRQHVQSPDKAIETFKKVLEEDKDNIAARNALVEIYSQHETYQEEAIRQHRILLAHDPLRVDSYRALAQIYLKRKELDPAYCLFQIIASLGHAEEKEIDFIFRCSRSSNKNKLRSDLTEALRQEILERSEERCLPGLILKALGEPMRELFWDDGLMEEGDEPLGVFARQLKEWIGEASPVLQIGTPEVRIGKSISGGLAPFGGHRPSLFVAPSFIKGNFGVAEKFKVGRALDSFVGAREVVFRLDVGQLQRLFLIVVKCFFPEFKISGPSEVELRSDLKRFKGAIPRHLRSSLNDAVAELARTWEAQNFLHWHMAVHMTGNRTGLLLGGEFEPVVSVLMSEEGISEGVSPPRQGGAGAGLNRLGVLKAHISQSEPLKDLFRFGSSEEYFRLRKRIGQTLPAGLLIF